MVAPLIATTRDPSESERRPPSGDASTIAAVKKSSIRPVAVGDVSAPALCRKTSAAVLIRFRTSGYTFVFLVRKCLQSGELAPFLALALADFTI